MDTAETTVATEPTRPNEPTRPAGRRGRWLGTPSSAVRSLLIVGFFYRMLWFLVTPSVMTPGGDSDGYIHDAYTQGSLFVNIGQPHGYPMFLKVIGVLPERAVSIPIVQHLLGLLIAWLVWVLGRRVAARVGVSAWWAVPAVAFTVFSGDLTYYGHTAMTETLSFFAIILVCLLAERLTVERPASEVKTVLWLALALGVTIGVGQTVRTSIGPTAAVLVVLTLIWVRGMMRRLAVVGLALVGVALVMVPYVVAAHHSEGHRTGLGGIEGWMLYGRTSSFADCNKGEPPADLRDLCDPIPKAQRYGPFAYAYARPDLPKDRESKAVKKYGYIPIGNDDLRRYSISVIEHQPLDYIAAVLHDFGRYVAPDAGTNPFFSTPGPEFQEITSLQGDKGYGNNKLLGIKTWEAGPFAGYGESWMAISRFPPLLAVVFMLLPLCLLPLVRRREVVATILPLWLTGFVVAALPVALVSYEYRYGLATQILLAIIGPISLGILANRYGLRLSRSPRGTGAPVQPAEGNL